MNTEAMLLYGYANLLSSVFAETLVGSGSWFTQSLRANSLVPTAIGQVEEFHQRARINWLLDLNRESREILTHLIDNLGFEAGLRGSKFLCASVDPDSTMFEIFRRTGYCTYGWERFWQLEADIKTTSHSPGNDHLWVETNSRDIHDIQQFQRKHLPPAVRAVTPLANEALPEYVFRIDGAVYAYARVKKVGSKGLIQPIIAPNFDNWNSILFSLLESLKESCSIWYLKQSTGHDRLDELIDNFSAPITARRELMVKHFTIMEKNSVRIFNPSAENGHPDPVAPFMNTSKTQDNL